MSKMKTISQFCDDLQRTADELQTMADELRGMFSANANETPSDSPPALPFTLETVRAALAEKSRAGRTAKIRALLEAHGATKLSDIDPAEYAVLLAEAEVL